MQPQPGPPPPGMYLLVPNENNERVLHPGRVMQSSHEEVALEFAKAVAPPPGSDVNLFFEFSGKFMQQGASIVALREPEPLTCEDENAAPTDGFVARQVVVFKRIGQALSAESRGSFRVSVVTQDIFAQIEKDARCQIVDISPEGFGAVVSTTCPLGTLVRVKLAYEGEQLDGAARVQTVKQIGRSKFRCGFLVPSDEKEMRVSLQKITAFVQRMQLRRLKRSA